MFHYIGFSAIWPVNCCNIKSQHPECRPQTLNYGHFYTSFDPAVSKLPFSLCLHSGGGICIRPNSLFFGSYDKISVRNSSVRCLVIFQFLVSPSSASSFKCPIGGINTGSVKFIRPN